MGRALVPTGMVHKRTRWTFYRHCYIQTNLQFRPNNNYYQLRQTNTKTSTVFWQAALYTDQQTTTLHCNKLKAKVQLPYVKLVPKVHKRTDTAFTTNVDKLTGRPIITAHSWTTSNPSRLLGTELDKIIFQLKTVFEEGDVPFPLIYNSTDLLDLLHDFYIDDIDKYTVNHLWLHIIIHHYIRTFHTWHH